MKYRILQYFDCFIVQREYTETKYPNILYELFNILGTEIKTWKSLDENGRSYIIILQNIPKRYKHESEARKAIESFVFNKNPKIINVE